MDAADRLAVLEAAVARLEALVAEQAAEIVLKDGALIAQRDRIAELERALEDVRRGGKRQAAPFSKGNIERHPKRPASLASTTVAFSSATTFGLLMVEVSGVAVSDLGPILDQVVFNTTIGSSPASTPALPAVTQKNDFAICAFGTAINAPSWGNAWSGGFTQLVAPWGSASTYSCCAAAGSLGDVASMPTVSNTYSGSVSGDCSGVLVSFQTGSAANLVWAEEFSGAANAVLPSTFAYDLSGSNQNLQYNNPPTSSYHNSLQDGKSNLVLAVRAEAYGGYSYTGAQVYSTATVPNPGFVEIAAKLPCIRGVWPTLWFMGSPVTMWPYCGEVDLAEIQTAYQLATAYATLIKPGSTQADTVQAGSAIIGSASATTLAVSSGANFAVNSYYIIDFGTGSELVKVTAISANTLTVSRNAGGNGASAGIAAGNKIYTLTQSNYGGSSFAASSPYYDNKWHRWGVYFDTTQVDFYRDGVLYWSVPASAIPAPGWYQFQQRPQVVYLSLYVGGSGAGTPNNADLPAYAYVDYVRVYNRPPY